MRNALKRARNRWELLTSYLRREETTRGVPASLAFENTTECDLHCTRCVRDELNRPVVQMDLNLFHRVLDEVGDTVDLVHLYGLGEPLLGDNLVPMLEECRRRGIPAKVCTNATHLTEDKAEQLLRAGLSHVIIGVDGYSKQTYETLRAGASFERVHENIDRFLALKEKLRKRTFVAVQMLRLPETEAEVEPFIRRWQARRGVNAVRIKADEVTAARHDLNTLPERDARTPCPFPWLGHLDVMADGAYHYHGWSGQMYEANARDVPVRELWSGEEVRRWRRAHLTGDLRDHPGCLRCAAPKPKMILMPATFLLDQDFLFKRIHLVETMARRMRWASLLHR